MLDLKQKSNTNGTPNGSPKGKVKNQSNGNSNSNHAKKPKCTTCGRRHATEACKATKCDICHEVYNDNGHYPCHLERQRKKQNNNNTPQHNASTVKVTPINRWGKGLISKSKDHDSDNDDDDKGPRHRREDSDL